MSVGPLSFAGSAAATPLAQSKGSDVDRAEQETAAQQREFQHELKAEQAAGIGQTDGEEHETEDRDADGRRLWELPAKKPAVTEETAKAEELHSRDVTGQCGNQLDLTG
jgi:hypothetical protein